MVFKSCFQFQFLLYFLSGLGVLFWVGWQRFTGKKRTSFSCVRSPTFQCRLEAAPRQHGFLRTQLCCSLSAAHDMKGAEKGCVSVH
jgi:hypothetical protein